MSKKIEIPKMRDNLFSFLEEYKKSSKLSQDFGKILPTFNSLFSSSCAYTLILEKAHIIKEDGSYIELVPLKSKDTFQTSIFVSAYTCSPIFRDLNKNYNVQNRLGITIDLGKEVKEEYILLFDDKGETSIITKYEDKTIEGYTFESSQNTFILNLLLIISGIMKNKFSQNYTFFVNEIIKKNPTSTIDNIYRYIKRNSKGVAQLVSKLNKLDAIISAASSRWMKPTNIEGNGLYQIDNHFIVKSGEFLIPYLITEENKIPVIKLDVESDMIKNYTFSKECSLFPALFLFKKDKMIPYFLKQYDFNELTRNYIDKDKKNKYAGLKMWNLLETDRKIEELLFEEKMEYQNNLREWKEAEDQRNRGYYYKKDTLGWYKNRIYKALVEKNWDFVKRNKTEEIEKNIKTALSITSEFMSATRSKDIVSEEEKTIKKAENIISDCKNKIKEIISILGKIYKNEILISNL